MGSQGPPGLPGDAGRKGRVWNNETSRPHGATRVGRTEGRKGRELGESNMYKNKCRLNQEQAAMYGALSDAEYPVTVMGPPGPLGNDGLMGTPGQKGDTGIGGGKGEVGDKEEQGMLGPIGSRDLLVIIVHQVCQDKWDK